MHFFLLFEKSNWFKHILFQIVKYKNEKGLGRATLLSEPSPDIHTKITPDSHRNRITRPPKHTLKVNTIR